MNKLIVALLCTLLTVPALAEDQGAASQMPADVDMANARGDGQAASAPAAPAPAPSEQAQPSSPGGEQDQATQPEPKSSIPLDKRQGPDITKCLDAGDKSDQAINACADKYRPRSH